MLTLGTAHMSTFITSKSCVKQIILVEDGRVNSIGETF